MTPETELLPGSEIFSCCAELEDPYEILPAFCNSAFRLWAREHRLAIPVSSVQRARPNRAHRPRSFAPDDARRKGRAAFPTSRLSDTGIQATGRRAHRTGDQGVWRWFCIVGFRSEEDRSPAACCY